MTGTYVTVEGIDGSGKTTLVEALGDELGDTRTTHEPSELWTGDATRESFRRHDAMDLTTFFMFMADRAEHCGQIVEPSLESHEYVISDRGPDSTRAYQKHKLGTESIIIGSCLQWTRTPDVTLWIDIDIDTAAKRIDCEDDFEERMFLSKVQSRYEQLWRKYDRIHRIDGKQRQEDVVTDALKVLE